MDVNGSGPTEVVTGAVSGLSIAEEMVGKALTVIIAVLGLAVVAVSNRK